MHEFLRGMRVVEGASFIAAPLCGLSLLEMGAEVIRFDPIGGGPDYRRWPQTPDGRASLYWEGLNKGKKSVAIALDRPEGRELAAALVTAPGDSAGLFVTNYPVTGFLGHERLAARRPDLVSVRVMGWADGGNALDYTVNAGLGLPLMTGPADLPADVPVNHVLPAWDIATGLNAALALVCAAWRRSAGAGGAEIRVPLGDVAKATIAALGQVAEVAITGRDRPRTGNDLYGALGRDFVTADGRRVMIVALTRRQWRDLVAALGIGADVAAIEAEHDIDLAAEEGNRFRVRDLLNPLIQDRIGRVSLAGLERLFAGTGVCWEPYRSVGQAFDDGLLSAADPLFEDVTHASGASYPTPRSPVSVSGGRQHPPAPAPALGRDTDEVLATVLGLATHEIGRLHQAGIVAGPRSS